MILCMRKHMWFLFDSIEMCWRRNMRVGNGQGKVLISRFRFWKVLIRMRLVRRERIPKKPTAHARDKIRVVESWEKNRWWLDPSFGGPRENRWDWKKLVEVGDLSRGVEENEPTNERRTNSSIRSRDFSGVSST